MGATMLACQLPLGAFAVALIWGAGLSVSKARKRYESR